MRLHVAGAIVPGIDAMLLGHSHQVFPNAASAAAPFNLPGVDKLRGLVHGVPTVMANFWGKSLGVIALSLERKAGRWIIDHGMTKVEVRSIQNADRSFVEPAPEIAASVEVAHQATITYVKTPIGTSDFAMSSYFADVGDVTAIQIVNQAQADYVSRYIKSNLPQFAALPVLGAAAPFKTGFAGGNDFTDVAAGNIAINSAADLYLYPNTLYAVKISGADLKNWLEAAARRFRQIDPTLSAEQGLIGTMPGYNFDMFTDDRLRYEIDVTKPVGQRIKELTFLGAAVLPRSEFVIATNNYRASGGGGFPGIDGTKTIIASPDTNRDVLIEHIKSVKGINRGQHGSTRSWRFSKVVTAGPVTFKSAQGKLPLALAAGLGNISVLQLDDGSGKSLSTYQIDLSK